MRTMTRWGNVSLVLMDVVSATHLLEPLGINLIAT